MKKLLTVFALVACIFAANAQDKKHEIGVVVGTFEGLSYRYNLNEHLSIQADLGWNVIATGKGSDSWNAKSTVNGITEKTSSAKQDKEFKTENPKEWKLEQEREKAQKYGIKGWTFELNPNLIYRSSIAEWNFGGLSWFVGGGISLGFGKYTNTDGKWSYEGEQGYIYEGTYDHYGDKLIRPTYGPLSGKFGLNAIGGVELALSSIPLTFGIDFRPGYGLFFDHFSEDGVEEYGDETITWKESGNIYHNIFDWKLGITARYCF